MAAAFCRGCSCCLVKLHAGWFQRFSWTLLVIVMNDEFFTPSAIFFKYSDDARQSLISQ